MQRETKMKTQFAIKAKMLRSCKQIVRQTFNNKCKIYQGENQNP